MVNCLYECKFYERLHRGVEVDFAYRMNKNLTVEGYVMEIGNGQVPWIVSPY